MSSTSDDLSAIAWVREELRKSLEVAHKALRRFLKDREAVTGSDIDAVDPGVLRTARAQIHQGTGALELVGLPAAAIVLRASEAAVQRSIAKPQSLTADLVADIERASFALLDYLARLLAGKHVSSLALFPAYRAVQEAVDAERVHPADLWALDWRWREIEVDSGVAARQADGAVRAEFEEHLLSLMRGTQTLAAAAKMSELCAGLAAGSSHPHVRTFWSLAAAMFEAQRHGLLGFDVFTKRVSSRLLAQLRLLQRGDSDVSERLARDLLFFCAQAAPGAPALRLPFLAAARSAYGFVEQTPTDYAHSVLGRFDPALVAHAKKRVAAAKEAWSATAGGEMHRLSGLAEQFALVADSLRKLFPFGESFAAELQGAVAQTQQAQAAPPAPLAMEVATSLLYVEAALEDGDFDDPALAERSKRLGERLAAVRGKAPPEPLELWMEELYRRVSDRQTMGSVVQELRASLGEIEKAIDKFFRHPGDRGVLVDVPVQLNSMRGVLSVLGMEPAAHAIVAMRDEVDGIISTEIDLGRVGAAGVFERLAGNLSALGFMIDMLSVQPQMAKSLFAYDDETRTLAPVMGRTAPPSPPAASAPVEPRLLAQAQMLAFTAVRDDVPLHDVARDLERLSHEAQAADQPVLAAAVLKAREAIGKARDDPLALASVRGELSEALVDFVATSTEAAAIAPPTRPAPLEPISLAEDVAQDDEMRDIFLEEAREVLEAATAALDELRSTPDDVAVLTTLRRSFHTLKGSSRMVGLGAFGEAAWACEQVFNTQLAEQHGAEPNFIEFTGWALSYLGPWVDDVAARRDSGRHEGAVKSAAERLARGLAPARSAADFAAPAGLRADADLAPVSLPEAAGEASIWPADGLGAVAPTHAPEAPWRSSAQATMPIEDVAFELDLSGLDALPAAGSDVPAAPLPAFGADASAMYTRFDDAREPVGQTTVANAGPFRSSAPVDLDLSSPSNAPALIQSLVPSAGADGYESESGMRLDLSTGAALPVGGLRHDVASGVDLDLGDDAVDLPLPADDHVKIVGPLKIGIPLFNIYLNEADELSRRLTIELAEWALELHRPVGETAVSLAHSLAGSSATVGFTDLSHLARTLEHALARAQSIGSGTEGEARLFAAAADEIRRLLHQFAAGFLREPAPSLLGRLAEHEVSSAERLQAALAAAERAGRDSGSPADAAFVAVEPTLVEPTLVEPTLVEPTLVVDDEPASDAAEAVATPAVPLSTAMRLDEAAEDVTAAGSARSTTTDFASISAAAPQAGLDVGAEGTAPQPEGPSSTAAGIEPSGTAADAWPALGEAEQPGATVDGLLPISAGERPGGAADEWPGRAEGEQPGSPAGTSAAFDDALRSGDGAELAGAGPFGATALQSAVEPPDEASPRGGRHAPAEPVASTFGGLDAMHPLGVVELKPLQAAPVEPVRPVAARASTYSAIADDIDAVDAVDLELFPIFAEEAQELLPKLDAQLRNWLSAPAASDRAAACMRTLHTLKGGARLAGAMRLGEMAHRLETRIERLTAAGASVSTSDIEALQGVGDAMTQAFEALRSRDAQAYSDAIAAAVAVPLPSPRDREHEASPPIAALLRSSPDDADPRASTAVGAAAASEGARSRGAAPSGEYRPSDDVASSEAPKGEARSGGSDRDATPSSESRQRDDDDRDTTQRRESSHRDDGDRGEARPGRARRGPGKVRAGQADAAPSDGSVAEPAKIDWSRFEHDASAAPLKPTERAAAAQSAVRVRAPLLDRLVNQAGEVSITRSRIESGVGQIKGSLSDLTDNLERLRGQLRDIELQGEVQMSSRLEAAKAAAQAFDPLEFDRFTRFQELTRMMAESVNDVATVQRTLQRSLESTEDELVAQARLTRDLQDDLLRTRMVEFEGLSDRLYRVVRQAAKETGKQVRLDLVGGRVEVDRGVLDRMTPAFEHLLRNCVTHGIELPEARARAGKEATGEIVVALSHEGNEVGVEFRDDGAGLDMALIRAKGEAMGLVERGAEPSDAELANLIFTPGFSTAQTVTELAGRGVGMDVVRSEVVAMGGRVETATAAGQGTSFKLLLPLTTAVTQVVMLRCGQNTVAVPTTLVELVRRATSEEVAAAYASGSFPFGEQALPFFWLGALLELGGRPGDSASRTRAVVIVRSAQQRIAVHVDEVLGNQEVVVKNLGPQLSRLPGLAGMTLLASGAVSLIYNPVALATLYGDAARAAVQAPGAAPGQPARPVESAAEPPAAPLILVVDDSLTVRRVTQRLLAREGYRVALAKDGLDALERLAEEIPQIVLSDIEMPRMDGFDLVRNLRADARWRSLPVIMITSRIAVKHREHAVELGVDHYLGKPYAEEDLLALIGRYTTLAEA